MLLFPQSFLLEKFVQNLLLGTRPLNRQVFGCLLFLACCWTHGKIVQVRFASNRMVKVTASADLSPHPRPSDFHKRH
ncbi:MAG TPA: hypothetical protein DCS71_00670 [Flavobacteriales bacterium]|nr:hypothetical protein [Flavobacteriales bacterium]